MVNVELWGCGVRHVQILYLSACMAVASSVHMSFNMAWHIAARSTSAANDNETLFDDHFKNMIKHSEDDERSSLHQAKYLAQFSSSLLFGVLSQKCNQKYLLLFLQMSLACLTYSLPLMAESIWMMFSCMVIEGILLGGIYPVVMSILANWMPYTESARSLMLVVAGDHVGQVITVAIADFFYDSFLGWNSVFLVVGNMGILWCVNWFSFGHHIPEKCFYISAHEKYHLRTLLVTHNDGDRMGAPIPWRGILSCPSIYCLCLTHLAYEWFSELHHGNFISWNYLTAHHGLDEDYAMRVIHYPKIIFIPVLMCLALLVDTLITKDVYPTIYVRKTCQSIGCWGTAVSLVFLSYFEKKEIDLVLLVGIEFTLLLCTFGSGLTPFDLAPNFVGVIVGMDQFLALTPIAFIRPIVSSDSHHQVSNNKAMAELYQVILGYGALCMFVANFFYIIMASDDLQKWNTLSISSEYRSSSRRWSLASTTESI